MSKILGQQVNVENRPGAGGNLGGAEAARAAPDGQTLFMTTSGINAINPALAVTGAKRDPLLPDVPTVAEAGVPGYESGVWFGLAVPAGTPKEEITRLNDAAVKGTRSPEFVKRMTELGYSIIGSTPEQMAAMNRVEVARWVPALRESSSSSSTRSST